MLDSAEGALLGCDGATEDAAANVELWKPYVLETAAGARVLEIAGESVEEVSVAKELVTSKFDVW